MGDVWWPAHKPNSAARAKLLCFPYAGGSSAAYRSWIAQLGPEIEVAAIELPGRSHRFGEEPARNLAALLPDLAGAVSRITDHRPFAFFGHSMGTAIAYELARYLEEKGARLPVRLFLSGSGPDDDEDPLHVLNDKDLVARLRKLGGIPDEVYENAELMELVLPILRADLELVETHPFPKDRKVSVPIDGLGGDSDPEVSAEDIARWQAFTTTGGATHILAGGHFFLRDQEKTLLALVKDALLKAK